MEQSLTRVLLLLSASAAFAKYVHIKEKKNWYQAQEYCQRVHTDLAPISNENDTERLRLLTNDINEGFWIGLQRNLTNRDEWTWSGGGKVSTFFWVGGKPNDGENLNYGAIHHSVWYAVDATFIKRSFLCYRAIVVRERKTWEDALEYCRAHHHDLASVASDTEMLLMQKELNEDETTAHVWIGLRFLPGGWLWVDGQPLAYEAWGQEGKAECPEVKERCAALQVTGGTSNGATSETLRHQVYGSGLVAQNLLGIPGDSLPPSSNTKTAMEQSLARVLLLLSASAAFAKYVHIKEKKNWYQAQEYCRRVHTDLAPISNENDTERLKLLTGDTDESFWIGLQRNLTNRDEWTWSGGGKVSTFFWAKGQPDDRELQNHGAIRHYVWHDLDAMYTKRSFLCYRAIVVRERKTWEEALEYCRARHHDLASDSLPPSSNTKTAMEQSLTRVLLLLSASAAFAKYVHIPEEKDWYEAQEYCRRVHTDLAPISNTYDTERLKLLTGDTDESFWIGLQRNLTNRDEWTWSGGGKVSTFFWAKGQPDDRERRNHGRIRHYLWRNVNATHRERSFFCYRAIVVRERKTWEEALEYCRVHHLDLASVASDTEMLLMQKELNEDETTAHVWIGLRFLPGGWLWVDGQPLAYEAWGQEGKAECPAVKERCAALQVTGGTSNGATSETITFDVYGSGDDAQNLLGIPGVSIATADVKVKDWEAYDCAEKLDFICY
ncbi:Macrophage mannose receptor 1 [Liparis tanakae]|uniref:Macrophage mannose receptor 1 n=1 Tax=Liparis tanakae TaxID=230148 RepID=A0A4Z2HX73_9TELE|nr:Macrophage mannose receptor 1 [Liparis tanakae]